MLTNVHAMVMAITSIGTQIWVDQPIPLGPGVWLPWLTQKIELASCGCLQHGWFLHEVHADAMVVRFLGPACMITKQLLPSERRLVYLVVVDKYSSKFGYLLLTQACFHSSAQPTRDNRL